MVSQNLTLLFVLMMAVMMMVMMMLCGLRMKKAVMKLRMNLFLLLIPTVWQFVTTNYGTSLSMDCKYEP